MDSREWALIAALLGDAHPSPELKEWLSSSEGRRELAAYRHTMHALQRAYGDAGTPSARAPVFYTAVRAPIGTVWLAATRDGLVRVSFRRRETDFTAELRRRLRKEVVKSAERLRPIAEQMKAYFGGTRSAFDVPVDLSRVTPFQRRVLLATRAVRAGDLASYADIARRIGQPRASRAVGQALGRNPIPIVIPCHRVVASDGSLGGYAGGLAMKKKLLAIEGALSA